MPRIRLPKEIAESNTAYSLVIPGPPGTGTVEFYNGEANVSDATLKKFEDAGVKLDVIGDDEPLTEQERPMDGPYDRAAALEEPIGGQVPALDPTPQEEDENAPGHNLMIGAQVPGLDPDENESDEAQGVVEPQSLDTGEEAATSAARTTKEGRATSKADEAKAANENAVRRGTSQKRG